MIPNAGLDNATAYIPWSQVNTATNPTSGGDWMAAAAISENSSAPSAGDTGIGTEVARTLSKGGFTSTVSGARDAGADTIWVSVTRAYVFEISGDFNLAKYGYVPLSAGGSFSWIDLFREDPNDPGSDPVVLEMHSGDQLQLWRTLTVSIPWSVDLEGFVLTGTPGNDAEGGYDAYCGYYATGDGLGNIASGAFTSLGLGLLIMQTFWPNSFLGSGLLGATPQTADASRGAVVSGNTTGQFISGGTRSVQTYEAGDFYRDVTISWSTSQGNNAAWTAFFMPPVSGQGVAGSICGFKIVFDDPAAFEKLATHTFSLTLRVSWQEA